MSFVEDADCFFFFNPAILLLLLLHFELRNAGYLYVTEKKKTISQRPAAILWLHLDPYRADK